MNNVLDLKKDWTIAYKGKKLPATVPGDVTLDLYNNGLIKNPYFGLNHRDLHWITDSDFVYENNFTVSQEIFNSEEILLEFDGIDTFAEIYLNGNLIGYCDNMFLQFTFSVKEYIRKGNNTLRVKMLSTTQKMKTFDGSAYFAVFNVERLFIRKAQCHFGWDWAPDMPGYGIWGDVRIKGVRKARINDVTYKAYNDGNVSLLVELNYGIRPQIDFNGRPIVEHNVDHSQDEIRYTVATRPGEAISESNSTSCQYKIVGRKNFANLKVDNAQLWWPVGYGEQPLYAYKIELIHKGEVIEVKEGRLAFRTVELAQKPVDEQMMGYKILINGKEVFIKGFD